MDFKYILEFELLKIGDEQITVIKVLLALVVIMAARLFVGFFIKAFLKRFFAKRKVDVGRQYAIQTFLKYIVYTIALLWAMQLIGLQLTVLMGGAAALLVGIGLGLQQTFNDLISGIILLSEGTVDVGDVVQVDGLIGKVTSIGIRTSKVETATTSRSSSLTRNWSLTMSSI